MPITQGSWRKGIDWEFHLGEVPDIKSVTAAAAILLDFSNKKILLTYNTKRKQWVIPGGHIEKGETIFEGLKREIFEETGIKNFSAKSFAYRKVMDSTGFLNPSTGKPYPNPSYVSYFYGNTSEVPSKEIVAEECSEAKFFEIEKAPLDKKELLLINELIIIKNQN